MNRLPLTPEELETEAARLRAYIRDDSYDSDIAAAYWSPNLESARQRLAIVEQTLGYLSNRQE